jgi:hypothetical protein
MRHLLIFVLSASFLKTCEDDCRGFKMGAAFEIAANTALENCHHQITVTIQDIQDSRCPTDMVCIWAGMIVVEGQLQVGGQEYDLRLSNNRNASGFPEDFSMNEYTIKLIDVIPYPKSSGSQPVGGQSAILLISKRST